MTEEVTGITSLNDIMHSDLSGNTRLTYLRYLKLRPEGLLATKQQVHDYALSRHEVDIRRVINGTNTTYYDDDIAIGICNEKYGAIYDKSIFKISRNMTVSEWTALDIAKTADAFRNERYTVYIPESKDGITEVYESYDSGSVLHYTTVPRK